eukprot:CAMPEP_0176396774 /NCGR_PEP_ID=MMETSP0126-20121128/44544_1 /TAXON_ID=141414 ORGANISM="Strombidinopsis acuminatum, Strain SPMC142" /NCGR_SAMPLE_ID=MMETSP0126 /ASSEMBLY_ACC=CAM_ASM_000229 /LENGTH=71 /DNA_ID=CAMNT_0017770587 /DNA_START=208 /DNA_END=423 /DNA_ORIENTATION=-
MMRRSQIAEHDRDATLNDRVSEGPDDDNIDAHSHGNMNMFQSNNNGPMSMSHLNTIRSQRFSHTQEENKQL